MTTITHNGITIEPTAAELTAMIVARLKAGADPLAGVTWAQSDDITRMINRNLRTPMVGDAWEEQGGRYAGLSVTEDGKSCHLIVAEPACDYDMTWQDAMEWAQNLRVGIFADFELPGRVDSLLLLQRLKSHFAECAHWTKESHASDSDSAYYQDFSSGGQHWDTRSLALRARAVRRLVI